MDTLGYILTFLLLQGPLPDTLGREVDTVYTREAADIYTRWWFDDKAKNDRKTDKRYICTIDSFTVRREE